MGGRAARHRPGDLSDQPAGGLALSGTVRGSGAKSDATDAVLLANIVRTDRPPHRPLPADTELAQAIRVLARAQQDAVWARQQIGNQIRDLLNDFYPAALAAFAELPERWAGPRRCAHHPGRRAHPAQAAALTPRGCAGC